MCVCVCARARAREREREREREEFCVCVCMYTYTCIQYLYAGGVDGKRDGGLDLRGYGEEELEGDVTLWKLSKENFDTIKRQYPDLDRKIRNNPTVQVFFF